MHHRFGGPWSTVCVVMLSAMTLTIAACGGKGGGGGGTPGPTPLIGCANGASSVSIASESLTMSHRMFDRAPNAPYISGRIAVKFSGVGSEPEIGQAMTRIRATLAAPSNAFGYATYDIPVTENPAVAAATVGHTRGILEAKPIPARYLQDTIPDDTDFGTAAQLLVGPQTLPVQWDMYEVQMPKTWDTDKGSLSVLIAVIDTGYDANNIDVCSKVVGSAVFDFTTGFQDQNATVQDMNGHGTNVSGIAASVTNNVTRFAGVGWNIGLLEVRVFPNPTVADPNPAASSLDIAAAINWAVGHGARVVNLSVGAQGACDSSEQTAINNAVAAGVAIIVASGNEGLPTISAPADCLNVIAVGASAINDITNPAMPKEKIASYSNWGTNGSGLALVAPGGDPDVAQQSCGVAPQCDYLQWIVNNYSTTALMFPGHGVFVAGTSQAAPHVAGVAALMISKKATLAPGNIKLILQTNADDICLNCVQEGSGRLNALRALTNT